MSDIKSIISALELSMLRQIQNLHNNELISLSLYPELNEIKRFGCAFTNQKIRSINNQFWKDVLKHYQKMKLLKSKDKSKENIKLIWDKPIHYNPKFKRGTKTLCIKNGLTMTF